MTRPPAALVVMAALSCLPCWAEDKLEPPDLSRYLRWGPVRVRPRIELQNVGYDDNIFLNPNNRVSDYTATVTPAVDGLLLLGHRAFITFREQLDYTLYVDNNDQNFLDQRGTARLTVPFSGFGLFGDLTLNRVRERPIDRDDIRPRRNEEYASVGLLLQPGWRTDIELGALWRDWSYSDPDAPSIGETISDRLDREERGTRLNVVYRLLGRTDVLFDAEAKRVEFDNRTLVAGSTARRDSNEFRLVPGIGFGEGGALTGTVRAGWVRIETVEDAIPDLSEPVVALELIYRFNNPTRLRLEVDRAPQFAVYADNTYVLQTNGRLEALRYLNRIVGLDLSVAAGELTFPEASGATGRRDDVLTYSGGVRLRFSENSLGRRVEYRVRIGRWRRDSTIDIFDNSRGVFGVDAVVGF